MIPQYLRQYRTDISFPLATSATQQEELAQQQLIISVFLIGLYITDSKRFISIYQGAESSWLPPSEAILKKKIQRTNYVTALWRNVHMWEPMINFDASPQECGWQLLDGEYRICWFEGGQLPNEVVGSIQHLSDSDNSNDGELYDSDESECESDDWIPLTYVHSRQAIGYCENTKCVLAGALPGTQLGSLQHSTVVGLPSFQGSFRNGHGKEKVTGMEGLATREKNEVGNCMGLWYAIRYIQ